MFRKSFKSYLGEDVVYIFIKVWLKEVNIAVMWWKKNLTKNFWWLQKTTEVVRIPLNVGFGIMTMLGMVLK